MKRTIKTIGTIVTIIGVCLFYGIRAHAAESESIVNMDAVTDFKTADNGLQLYFNDGTGYYWEKENTDITTITNQYIPLNDDIIDMDTVVDFETTEYGLQLYFEDGSGYFLER